MSERAIWISAGLLGLVVAVGLAILTSHVSQPPVGVPGEPVSAGRQLAPARAAAGAADRATRPSARPATTAVPPPATAAPARRDDAEDDDASSGSGSGSGSDDDGSGRGRGRGRGGDD